MNQEALDFVKINIMGIFGHGCGHLGLGLQTENLEENYG